MSGIIETRNLNITNKIIRSQDIRRLFNDLENEFARLETLTDEKLNQILNTEKYKNYTEEQKDREKRYLKQLNSKSIKIKAFDGSAYEGESNEILAVGGILDTKQIMALSLDYWDNNHNVRLSINLRHTDDTWNDATVTGTDSLWVNGIIQKIENFLESLEPQSTWAKRYSFLLSLFFDICIAIVASNLLVKIIQYLSIYKPIGPNSNKISIESAKTIFFFLMFFAGAFPAQTLTNKIRKLWPTVELQTGQDYKQIEKH